MKKVMMTLFTAALFATSFATATEAPKMVRIHLDVAESADAEPTVVDLRIPLSMLQSMSPAIEDAVQEALQNEEMPAEVNLADMWASISEAGPGEYVNIQKGDQTVIVSADETNLNVDITGDQAFKLTMPLAVGDIFVGHAVDTLENGGTMDMDALIQALSNIEGDELLKVEGDQINARIWLER